MENSKILLQRAMSALSTAQISEKQWAVGGGTVLAYFFNHRLVDLSRKSMISSEKRFILKIR